MTQGSADAELMNLVCFDALALGNHEFDAGDQGLRRFLDFLQRGPCRTPALSANLRAGPTSPLRPLQVEQRIRPGVVIERPGQRIGVVGLTVAAKTRDSSRPDPGTELLPEAASAQQAIDALRASGVERIVLLSHQGYEADRAIARLLSGVDVIVGGDSHTLLGDAALAARGLPVGGDYPTLAVDRDGNPVCIVQAWQYSWVVGELRVRFDRNGRVERCEGQPHLLLGAPLRRAQVGAAALNDADRETIRLDLAAAGLSSIDPAPRASQRLADYAARRQAFFREPVAQVDETLCLRRVPGAARDRSRSAHPACNRDAFVDAHGGDVQQLVAQSLLQHGRAFGGADLALSNAGGARIDLARGALTVGDIHALLPFRSTLVRLTLSGDEVRRTLEDAIGFVLLNPGNTGAYPYAADLRWTLDLSQPAGSRIGRLEHRDPKGQWLPIDPNARYRVITIDFLASGKDGWTTPGRIGPDRREDLFLDYTDAFVNYARSLGVLKRPDRDAFSTQVFADKRQDDPHSPTGRDR